MKCVTCNKKKKYWGIVINDEGVCAKCLMKVLLETNFSGEMTSGLNDFITKAKKEKAPNAYWLYFNRETKE